jgi:hypothetical protein
VAQCQFAIEQKEDLIIVAFAGNGFLIGPHRVREIFLRDFLSGESV